MIPFVLQEQNHNNPHYPCTCTYHCTIVDVHTFIIFQGLGLVQASETERWPYKAEKRPKNQSTKKCIPSCYAKI